MADPAPEPPLETTALLLSRARAGDLAARDRLFVRVMPPLRRWAHQRMPSRTRDLHDTEDLVQVTLLRAFGHLDRFEPRGEGAFLGWLRQILLNAMRNDLRRAGRRGESAELHDDLPEPGPSALDRVIGRDMVERYDRALERLDPEDRDAVIMRIELDFSHQEIAEALGVASANAARMRVARALVRLAEGMGDDPRTA